MRALLAGNGAARGRSLAAILAVIGLLVAGITVLTPAASAQASSLAGSSFSPGTIISDVVMYNSSTMTVGQIQSFLNARDPHCDSGYTCLKNFTQTTTNYHVPSGYVQSVCAPYVGAANETAATIIYKVAADCGVNPQVILVILQKEESLVTDADPSSGRFRSAMGYGCPDTAACDSDFYGFFKQVYWGARAMQRPVAAYKPGVTSSILYSPNRACGTKKVTVTNKATSNLYTYTPYTPNSAALSNLKGSGNSCSAYGNRNFWVYFNTWFGSTIIPQTDLAYVQATYADLLGRGASTSTLYSQGKVVERDSSRTVFAHSVLTSTEYRTDWVRSLYTTILKRPGSSVDVAAKVAQLSRGSLSVRAMVDTFLASNEYFAKQSGNTETGWITALYQYVLGRAPSPAEITAATATLKSDSSAERLKFATALYKTTESDARIVTSTVQTYLARPVNSTNPKELSTLVEYMKKEGYNQTIAHVIGSVEYLANANTRFPVGAS